MGNEVEKVTSNSDLAEQLVEAARLNECDASAKLMEFAAARLRGEAAPESVRSLPAKWRALAEGFRNGTDIGNAEGACLAVSANELEAALSAAPVTGNPVLPAAPAPVAGDAVRAVNPNDTSGDIDGDWYCEEHPDQLQSHGGCGGAGIVGAYRLERQARIIRFLRQELRERDFQYGFLANQALSNSPDYDRNMVANMLSAFRRGKNKSYALSTIEGQEKLMREAEAALAQDRVSQAGAAGAPVLHKWQIDSLRYGLRLSPETHADDQIELALSAALLAAAPTPAAEREVDSE